jgi:hypothetical protein
MVLPCRLFIVEPVGETWIPYRETLPNKVACIDLRVVDEMPWESTLGPQGEQIIALIERCRLCVGETVEKLASDPNVVWNKAQIVAEDVIRIVDRAAAMSAAKSAAWDTIRFGAFHYGPAVLGASRAVSTAVAGLVIRDLIDMPEYGFTQAHYDTLTRHWRTTIGPIHPDDDQLEVTA